MSVEKQCVNDKLTRNMVYKRAVQVQTNNTSLSNKCGLQPVTLAHMISILSSSMYYIYDVADEAPLEILAGTHYKAFVFTKSLCTLL